MISSAVRAIGNLKYDVRAPQESRVAELVRKAAMGRPIVVAGSTVAGIGGEPDEEALVIGAWQGRVRTDLRAMLVLAPRHPQRFEEAAGLLRPFRFARASDGSLSAEGGAPEVVLLDTIGDLAAVYGVADVAFVGGSLVQKGGHNPLEPAQFAVPVVMGRSWENFRDIVAEMQMEYGLRGVRDKDDLERVLIELLTDRKQAKAMGERGRAVFEAQSGATGRAVEALLGMVKR